MGSRALAWLLVALALAEVPTRVGFDLFLEHLGLTPSEWEALDPREQETLSGAYEELLRGEGLEGKPPLEVLKRLRNPELLRARMDGSPALRPYLDLGGSKVEERPAAAVAERGDPARHHASKAAGLSLLEKLRPAPEAPKTAVPPAAKKAPQAPLDRLQESPWGRWLLESISSDRSGWQARTVDGARLELGYGDLSPWRQRGDTEVRPKEGLYRIVLDERLRGTDAELATLAHELSHVRDVIEYPEATPAAMGLLMEHRANLYEVASYLERHPDILVRPAPPDFFEREIWFKARVYVGGLGRRFVAESAGHPQMRAKAAQVVADCPPCGGTEALYRHVVDPIYRGTAEGNILDYEREALPDRLKAVRDRAEAYEEETRALDRRLRARFGI